MGAWVGTSVINISLDVDANGRSFWELVTLSSPSSVSLFYPDNSADSNRLS